MKGTIIITMFGIIVFLIASFFMFFAFDKMVSNELICILKETECGSRMSNAFAFGIYIILVLLVMIVSAAYIMAKNVSIDIEYKRKRAEQAIALK